MATWHKVYGFHVRAEWLCGDGADPAFAAFTGCVGTAGWVLSQLGIDFKFQLDHIPEGLHASAQDLFAVGL
jgi:hypothetical protein